MEQIFFGERIAAYRKEKQWTQETLAQKLGVTNQAVSKWETDQCCPDIMQLPELADLFGISLDELFGRDFSVSASCPVMENLPWPDDNSLRAVCYRGHSLVDRTDALHPLSAVMLHFTGNVQNIESAFSVTCTDCTIEGDISADDGVQCGDVGGSVNAGDGVKCGNVGGSVNAGDGVECGDIGGDAAAGDGITCGDIGGSANAGDGIQCGNIGGNATAGDGITCTGDILGSAFAEDGITCNAVHGTMTAKD